MATRPGRWLLDAHGVRLRGGGRRACARARADRIATGDVEPDGVRLTTQPRWPTGDVVVTRANRRTLAVLGGRDFVKNGERAGERTAQTVS